jgi:hypothetical protein
MRPRYASAGLMFDARKAGRRKPLSRKGPGIPAEESPPPPARWILEHYLGAGKKAGSCLPGPQSSQHALNVLRLSGAEGVR